MKTIIIITLLFINLIGCAIAWLSPRNFSERRYRPCQDFEVEGGISTSKFCHRYCIKYKPLHTDISENCKEWTTDVKDMSKREDFLAFRDGGFVLINEQRIK
jgi:hypothetical protein